MANSLIRGLLSKGAQAQNLFACDPDAKKLSTLHEECGIVTGSMADIAKQADVVLLAVKPQVMPEVCKSLAPLLAERSCLIISIAAGIPLSSMQSWLGDSVAIVRCMPNTPALVSAGATGMYANAKTTADQTQLAGGILAAVGIVCWLEQEQDIDAVTALSGSGPAYYFLMMEAMEAAAVKLGLSTDVARQLTLQTAMGAALLATGSNVPPAELRARVTSPGGTTEQAIKTFQSKGFEQLVEKAMEAAQRQSVELARNVT